MNVLKMKGLFFKPDTKGDFEYIDPCHKINMCQKRYILPTVN